MKFQITIKQQAQAVNGKAKYPLYKPINDKNFDDDKGLQALNQLMENSSIKIFCDDCEKQITYQAILIAYEGRKSTIQKEVIQAEIQKLSASEKKEVTHSHPENAKMKIPRQNQSKQLKQSHLAEDLFEEDEDDKSHNEKQSQEEQKQEQKLKFQLREEQRRSQEQKGKKTEQNKPPSQITRLYCVGCFACLDQFPPAYSVRKSLKFAVPNSSWRVIDEICLLNGLKLWGFGNWGEIKEFMDYNSCIFTVQEIQSHYEQFYLNCDTPSLANIDVFDITNAYKPPKKLIEQIMHNYYFPSDSEDNLQQETKENTQNQFKRKKPATAYEEEEKLDLFKTSSQKAFPSKQNKPGKSPLNNINFPSHTSLINSVQVAEQKTKKIDQLIKKLRESENQSMESEEEEEFNEQAQGQTKLKPRSSSKFPQNKNHQTAGKCLKQVDLSRSGQLQQQNGQKTEQDKEHNIELMRVHPTYSNLKGHNVYSYNPKRKQFEIIEYDCYAESMLAQLQFTEDDTEEEEQLKLKIIEEYNRRLDERIKRRQFVIEHRLLDTEFMIKTFKKYSKNNVQKFESFRRLLDKNQEYYGIVETYDTLCKTKAIAEGMIKLKRKLQHSKQNPNFKDVLDYLNKKKEKKELLGHRAKFENQTERKVLFKQTPRPNKKLILSMSENPSTYPNSSNLSGNAANSSQIYSHVTRTMVSRSEQRSRLRNPNSNRQDQKSNIQQPLFEEYTNNQQSQYNNQYSNGNTSLNSILFQEQINTIEKVVKRQTRTQGKDAKLIQFKPVPLKNYVLKPLSSFKNRGN